MKIGKRHQEVQINLKAKDDIINTRSRDFGKKAITHVQQGL